MHEATRRHPSTVSAITVVEIGSWQGRSTIALALGLRARGGGTVHAIDPHAGTELHRRFGVNDTHDAFLANLRRAGVEGQVRSVRSTSSVACAGFSPRSVHVLFVDGSHRYEDVLRDIDDWTPVLADVATVAFHDAVSYPGVRRALEERVTPPDSPFHNHRVVEETLVADFRRPAM